MINNSVLHAGPMGGFGEVQRNWAGEGGQPLGSAVRRSQCDCLMWLFLSRIFKMCCYWFHRFLPSIHATSVFCLLCSPPPWASVPSRLKRRTLSAMKHLLVKRNIYLFFLKKKRRRGRISLVQIVPEGSNTVLSLKNFLLSFGPWSWLYSDIYSKIEINCRSHRRWWRDRWIPKPYPNWRQYP